MAKQGSRFYALLLFEFSQREQQRLLDFLASPYCTGLPPDNPCFRLVDFTLKLGNRAAAEATSESNFLSAVYPDEVFANHKFNHLASDTNKLIQKFILSEMADKDERQQTLLLMRFYALKKLDKKFLSEAENLKDWQSNRKGWKIEDYLLNYQVAVEISAQRSRQNAKTDDLGLSKTIAALDEFYLLTRIYLSGQLLNQSRLAKLKLSEPDKNLPIDVSRPAFARFFKNPLVRLFWNSLYLLRGEHENEQSVFEAFFSDLSQDEAEVYLDAFEKYACNYLIGRIDAGQDEYLAQLFKLQKRRVESGRVFGPDGKILKGEFQSIVTVALRNGELAWAHDFIQACRPKIGGTQYPEDYYRYNLAHFYFYSQAFEAALNQLSENQSAFQDQQYKLSARILEIKIFYETNDLRRLKPHLDAIKMLFSREKKEAKLAEGQSEKGGPKVTDNKREMGKNFVNVMSRLLRVKEQTERIQVERIIKDIAGIEWLAERAWLLQKLQNLLLS